LSETKQYLNYKYIDRVFVNCWFCCFSVYCVIHDNWFLSFCSMPISNYSIRLILLHAKQRHVSIKGDFRSHNTSTSILYLDIAVLSRLQDTS